jgi:hypothetical protein
MDARKIARQGIFGQRGFWRECASDGGFQGGFIVHARHLERRGRWLFPGEKDPQELRLRLKKTGKLL